MVENKMRKIFVSFFFSIDASKTKGKSNLVPKVKVASKKNSLLFEV